MRARRELEERLEQARRDSRKFQTKLQQAQKEAESYKDRLQAIKEKDTEDEPAVDSVSGVPSGEQFARQLFMQQGALEVAIMPGFRLVVTVMTMSIWPIEFCVQIPKTSQRNSLYRQ